MGRRSRPATANGGTRDFGDDAYTINHQGLTIVLLEVRIETDGDVFVHAPAPDYARPGTEEVRQFE